MYPATLLGTVVLSRSWLRIFVFGSPGMRDDVFGTDVNLRLMAIVGRIRPF
jgi:hypothetical protein